MSTVAAPTGTVTGKSAGGAAARRARTRSGRSAQGVAPAPAPEQRRDGGHSYVYEVRRPIKVDGEALEIGATLPAALVESWPRPEAFIRSGKLVRRRLLRR